MFFGSELPLSLYFPVLLFGTRSLEIKALFALQVWGAYIWRGLYVEGLIFGILR